MIKVRLNALEEGFETERKDKENLLELVSRVLLDNGHKEINDNLLEHMTVLINGMEIERELWSSVYYEESDSVMVATVIRGGSFGQIFKQVAILAVAIVASVFLSPAVGGGIYGALAVAAATIGTTLILNSLIPPPSMDTGNLGGFENQSLAASQMYSITGQSNQVKKFGGVPKVYGRHRIFPVIAANPYTDIETDPSTGELVQFFYAIYDFGYGPLSLSDFKLGDTPFYNYSDIQYRLVDLNKPSVSQGPWDDVLSSSFEIYKGDIEQDNTSVAINSNEESGASIDDYQVIRNASPKVEGNNQEIILSFVCPRGLISYGTNGDTSAVNIDLEIHFSKVGEDNWKPFNDVNFVHSYRYAGGENIFTPKTCTILPATISNLGYFTLLQTYDTPYFDLFGGSGVYWEQAIQKEYGFKSGSNSFILSSSSAEIGENIKFSLFADVDLGKVINKTPHAVPGYSVITTERPINVDICVGYLVEPKIPLQFTPFFSPSIFLGTFTSFLFNLGKARISRKDTGQVYSTVSFKPREVSQYKVRVRRIRTFSNSSYQVLSDLSLYNLSTRFDRKPIITPNRHVFIEIRIRATNQLNGTINNLSAIGRSVLDVYNSNTQTWSKKITSNPAWVFCDLLTGELNKKAISKSRLHLPSIVEWAEFCEQIPTPPPSRTFGNPRFSTNFVLDFDATLQQVLNLVSNSAQASLNIVDGKYGVLLDKLKTVPVQIFTPRNSWGFVSNRNYAEKPHALKIGYIDPNVSWEARETLVYDNGYDENNATLFDTLDTFACTNEEQAWRFGRYMLAQNRLRQENISITVDFEHLVCTRGDYVRLVQDTMKVGGRAARIKSVSGIRVTIDDSLEIIPSIDYGYVFRSPSSGILKSTLTVISEDTFDLDGAIPSVGDLIVVGQVDYEYIDCLVKAIVPQGDLTAQLTLVEKADAIYSAESTGTLPDYSPQISITENTDVVAPSEVTNLQILDNTYRCMGSGYQYYITVDWDVPVGSVFSTFEVYADYGKGYKLIAVVNDTTYEFIVGETSLGLDHKFKVLALSATGKKLDLGAVGFVSAIPLSKTSPPSDIEALYLNVTGETIQIDWRGIDDCDISEYLIRYSPNLQGTWESSIPLLRTDRNTTLAQAQARTGTYLIKAVDFNGNESANASIAITSIPELTGLNIIEETNDFPTLTGELYQTVLDGTALILQKITDGGPLDNQYYSEGFYYFRNFLDLGEIYTVRLQSLIEAEGFTVDDIMSNWVTLDDVLLMANSRQSEWDVETQYRATDTFNVISEWLLLSDVTSMNEGVEDNWTEWRKFTIGDFSGRIFQFRLRLVSNKASVTPRVFNGVIRSDMPDRVFSLNNLTSTLTPYEIVYTPAFKGPGTSPNIQITQDDAERGDYYKITDKTLNGFKITFYDINDNPVIRTFDLAVKGYGRKTNAVI